jgi:hypothetical protein
MEDTVRPNPRRWTRRAGAPRAEAALAERGHERFRATSDLPLGLPPWRDRPRRDVRFAARIAHALASELVLATPVSSHASDRPTAPRSFFSSDRWPPDRVRVHPGYAGDDLLYLDAGRMRHGVRVLPDRQDGPGAEPHGGRNCRTRRGSSPTPSRSGTRRSTSC